MSSKKATPLEQFKLFYEELIISKPLKTRVRRIRQANANG